MQSAGYGGFRIGFQMKDFIEGQKPFYVSFISADDPNDELDSFWEV